ncbi:hypothetical protein D3C84_889360 [compost metagenome]
MNQRCIFTFAERRDETVSGQLLAGARARRLAGQSGFQCFGIERDILGQAIGQQVFEPHGVNLSSTHKEGIILRAGTLGQAR